jgi:UDP-GlcNAc:undecaprenyl-phosphate GlcNAc-1-phosphate transferase
MSIDLIGLTHYISILLFVSISCFAVSPLIIWFSRKINLIDIPGIVPHHIHKRVTPLSGGLFVLFGFVLSTTIFKIWNLPGLFVTFIATIIIFFFGIWDDLRGLNPLLKLFGQIIATTFLIINGIRIQFLESPQIFLGGPIILYTIFDVILTYLWVIGITNALNLIDSMDGLAIGLVISALVSYIIGSIISEQNNLIIISILFLGICSTIFYFNSAPAIIFLGDSGAQTLGFVLSIISILFTPKNLYQASSWFLPILVLGVPIFDTSLVIISRLRRRIPIYRSGLDHSYHRLVRLGVSSQRSVAFLNFIALALDCIAFIALTQTPLIANGIFFACIAIGIVSIVILDSKKSREKMNNFEEI